MLRVVEGQARSTWSLHGPLKRACIPQRLDASQGTVPLPPSAVPMFPASASDHFGRGRSFVLHLLPPYLKADLEVIPFVSRSRSTCGRQVTHKTQQVSFTRFTSNKRRQRMQTWAGEMPPWSRTCALPSGGSQHPPNKLEVLANSRNPRSM